MQKLTADHVGKRCLVKSPRASRQYERPTEAVVLETATDYVKLWFIGGSKVWVKWDEYDVIEVLPKLR